MMDKQNALNTLIEAGKNYVETARERSEGRRAVGHVITDVPVEFIHAAGLYPVAILGHRGEAGKGREHFQSFTCSYSRGVLDMFLDGTLDFLDGVIVPFVCDTTRAVDVILRYAGPDFYIECYRPPRSLTGRGSREYLLGELARLKESIGKFAGAEVTDEKILSSIKIYNKARSELRRLLPMRDTDPDGFYTICRAFLVLPVEEFIDLASNVGANVGATSRSRSSENSTESRPEVSPTPVMFAGKVVEPGDLMQVLHDAGAKVVADDLVTGSRLFGMDVDEGKKPLDAIADRQINNIPFVGFTNGPEDRLDYIVRVARESGAGGVIISMQKFCEPFEIDTPEIRERLKREDIPALVIETDYEPETSGALRTRIEAFLEMIHD